MSMKKKILLYTIEVLLILLVITGLAIFKYYPEYKKTLGSSDGKFIYENYKSAVEIQIPTGPNYIVIVDKKNKISNIFFENLESFVLYNQEIENKPIYQAIAKMMEKLQEANYLSQSITVINYNNQETYDAIVEEINKSLITYGSTTTLIKKTTTLEQKAKELELTYTDETSFWAAIALKSSDLISYKRNNVSKKNKESTTIEEKGMDLETARTYANNIYQKLQVYVANKSIKNQQRDDPTMPIQLLPADNAGTIYTTTDSWYYINDYKIYAEISFENQNQTYSFCYMGSLEHQQKGKCEV